MSNCLTLKSLRAGCVVTWAAIGYSLAFDGDGSIIGGLYAIGLTPEEIENGVRGIEWEKVFNDFAYREYKTFRRKKDDFDFFNIHRIGITDAGLQLSPSLIEGQQIEIALDRLAYPGFHNPFQAHQG